MNLSLIRRLKPQDWPSTVYDPVTFIMSEDIRITPLDHLILQNGGVTVNIERLPSHMQAAKCQPPPTLQQLLEENGRLREEIAYYQSALQSFMTLFEQSRESLRILQFALTEISYRGGPHKASAFLFQNSHQAFTVLKTALRKMSDEIATSEQGLLDYFGICLDDTSSKDFEVL